MSDIAVRVDDPGLARQVYDLVAAARLDTGEPGPHTSLLVTDSLPVSPSSPPIPTVMVVADPADATLWRAAGQAGVEQVVALPDGAALLGQRLRLRRQSATAGTLLRVIGARGGCGATTLAVGIAAELAEHTSTVLLDADPAASGLDLALGVEGHDGLRWGDLAGVRGPLPASSVLGRLPAARGIPILSHGRHDADIADAWQPVVESLLAGVSTAVADVPRYRAGGCAGPEGTVDVIVVPHEVVAVANARRLIDRGLVCPDPVIALRRIKGPMPAGSVGELLPARAVIPIPECTALRAGTDFGDLAPAVRNRTYAQACRRVIEGVTGVLHAR